MPQRRLIVNADDFGISPGVNRGIILAHEHGIVTSTSLMTRWTAAADAAAYARDHPRLGVGLHVDLGEWILRNGQWEQLYYVVSQDDPQATRDEIHRQLEQFRALLGKNPDHLDSHQHAHREEPARSVLLKIAHELAIPLRHFSDRVRYCGEFYGQDDNGQPYPELIGFDSLCGIISRLPQGVTELCCHPAAQADLQTMYSSERLIELQTLCDPRLKLLLAETDVQICSFTDL